jgi:hypothetical protein
VENGESAGDPILRRIARELGGDRIVDALIRLAPRDLQSLLLHVVAARTAGTTPAEVLARYEESAASRRGIGDARPLAAFTVDAYEAAAAFEAWPVAPVLPLGAARVLAGIHPNNVLASVRPLEVLSDPTIAFALEAAHRRRDASTRDDVVRLCAVARVIRMQPLKVKGLLPHFALFALASAGRGGDAYVRAALRDHLAVHLDLFRRLVARGAARFDAIEVELSDVDVVTALITAAGVDPAELRGRVKAHDFGGSTELLASRGLHLPRGRAPELATCVAAIAPALRDRLDALDAEVLAPLSIAYPEARFAIDLGRLEGLGYYAGPCLRIAAIDPSGARFPLVDGGSLAWTQRLLSDARERYVTSGVGPDLVCARFTRQ